MERNKLNKPCLGFLTIKSLVMQNQSQRKSFMKKKQSLQRKTFEPAGGSSGLSQDSGRPDEALLRQRQLRRAGLLEAEAERFGAALLPRRL